MIVVYRKLDLLCVGTVIKEMTFEQEIELNVIPNFGGTVGDYNYIETEETLFHLELIDGIVSTISDIPIPEIIQPTPIEQLQSQITKSNADLISLKEENDTLKIAIKSTQDATDFILANLIPAF